MSNDCAPTRYGKARIRRGLLHFLLGKGISSLAGFAYLVLLVRQLSVAEFATYSVLQAFIEVFTAVTGFGLTHAALRYVPELYARHENQVFRGLVPWAFGLRLGLLTIAVLLVWTGAETVAPWFGLNQWIPVFQAYLLVVWLRVNTHFLFQLLESTLHQGIGQSALSLAVLAKLGGLIWIAYEGPVDILAVVKLEALADAVGAAMLLVGFSYVLMEAKPVIGNRSASHWWREHAGRVTRYALAGYAQHLAILPYGSAPNRLLAGRFLEAGATAAFGFAQSFTDLFRRYLPAQLLGGLIRPVLIAQYSVSHDFSKVSGMLGLVFRVNTMLIGAGITVLLVAGSELVSLTSKGKYGDDASWLLIAMLVVLILESRRFLMDIAIQTVERNFLLVLGNAFLAASLLLAIAGITLIGALAIPAASALALLIGNAWMSARLRSDGFDFKEDSSFVARLVFAIVLPAAGGLVLKSVAPWWIDAFLALGGYLLMLRMAGTMRRTDFELLKSVMRPRNNAYRENP